ncbi:hypothetical protein ACN28S_24150 [Cystobacter fuscus]
MLDVSIRVGVLNLMERLKEERGISYLYITHDLASARYFADRTMVLYAGNLVESAPSEELMQRPAHPYTQLLLSAVPDPTSPMTGELKAGRARPCSSIRLRAARSPRAAPTSCPSAASRCRAGHNWTRTVG